MNVRLSADSLRFRVDRSELEALIGEASLEFSLVFPGGTPFVCAIVSNRDLESAMAVTFEKNCLTLFVATSSLESLRAKHGKEASLESDETRYGGNVLRCSLEVDFKTS